MRAVPVVGPLLLQALRRLRLQRLRGWGDEAWSQQPFPHLRQAPSQFDWRGVPPFSAHRRVNLLQQCFQRLFRLLGLFAMAIRNQLFHKVRAHGVPRFTFLVRNACDVLAILQSQGKLRLGAYFSPSWTTFQAERGRDFSVIVDGISN